MSYISLESFFYLDFIYIKMIKSQLELEGVIMSIDIAGSLIDLSDIADVIHNKQVTSPLSNPCIFCILTFLSKIGYFVCSMMRY